MKTGIQAGYQAVARYILAMAIHDARANYTDYDCPEEEPQRFFESAWAMQICEIAELDPAVVLNLLPKPAFGIRGKATRFIEISPPSRGTRNVVLGYHSAARLIGCDPTSVYRTLVSGRTQVNGWGIRYKEQDNDR